MVPRPLFSIVTVTLNCLEDAQRTARSVLSQSFQDYEYIIKDGGSTDGTLENLKSLGLAPLVHKDASVYDAMNQALEYCSGDYVCFLNAGDHFSSNSVLEHASEWIRSNDLPDFVYGDVVVLERLPAHPEFRRCISYPSTISKSYLFRKMICHQAWFVKKSMYNDLGCFNTAYRYAADYDFLLKNIVSGNTRFSHFPFFIVNYKGHGLSSTNTEASASEKHHIQIDYYSPIEIFILGYVGQLMSFLAVNILYKIYPYISSGWRARLNGR